MSWVPERNVCAIFTTASAGTGPRRSSSEFSRARPLLALVSRSIAVSISSSPRS